MAKKGFLEGYQTYDTSKGHGNPEAWRSAFNERFSTEEATEILSGQEQTPYEILGLKPGATQEAIKKAFRKKIMECHPDRNPHREAEAEEMSKKIIAAYSLLYRS